MIDKKYVSHYQGKEIDDLLDKINNLDIGDYYSKEEADKLLSEKADIDKYYDKTQIDQLESFEDDALPAQTSVGNIAIGTELAGLSLKTILKMMLYGEVKYPELTNPSFSYVVTNSVYGIGGMPHTMKGELLFDRGLINPAYKTSGYRAGLPYRYVVSDKQASSDETTFAFTYEFESLLPGENEIPISVYYREGEQPLNSLGGPYDSPYPAGVLKDVIEIVGLSASFSGIEGEEFKEDDFPTELIPIDDRNYEESGLFGKDDEIYGYQIKTPGIVSIKDVQAILLPDSVEIYGIQSWNILSGGWDWFYGENAQETVSANTWIKTDEIISREIDGVAVNYRKYKFNTEDYGLMDENYFRFFIKEVE